MLGGQISTTLDQRLGHLQQCFLQEKQDIFDETLGQFPAVFDGAKPGVFYTTYGQFTAVFMATKPGVFYKTFGQYKVMFVVTKNLYLTSWGSKNWCFQQVSDIFTAVFCGNREKPGHLQSYLRILGQFTAIWVETKN